MIRFEKLTIAILASNEQELLRETVRLLGEGCAPEDIEELIIFFISDTCPAKAEFDRMLEEGVFPFPVRGCVQQQRGFSACFYEIPQLVKSSHFLILGADLEMNPLTVPELIARSKEQPEAIICASKWAKGSNIQGYRFLHKVGTTVINTVVKHIVRVDGTELIATFQIYPTEIYRQMNITDPSKAFCEFTLKPLVEGVPYIEIPTDYVRRNEGESNFFAIPYLKAGAQYVFVALRLKREKRKKHDESR